MTTGVETAPLDLRVGVAEADRLGATAHGPDCCRAQPRQMAMRSRTMRRRDGMDDLSEIVNRRGGRRRRNIGIPPRSSFVSPNRHRGRACAWAFWRMPRQPMTHRTILLI